MQAYSKEVNFTTGSILRSIIAFSMPLVLGELLQNLYNSVDAVVVGKLVGESALAAVSVCGVIASMIVNFFNGMSVGANVVVSRTFGKDDQLTLRRQIRIAFTFSTLLGVSLSILGILCAPLLLHLADVQAAYYHQALTYLRIYLAGLMFTVIYNNGAGILRAVGASSEAFRILAFACGANIALDLLLTAVIPLGIAGVGIATVIAQAGSAFWVSQAIGRRVGNRSLNFSELFHEGGSTVADILSIGISAGVQSALIGISNLFVVRYMNFFDTATVAGIGIAQKVDRFIVMPTKAFGITMTTFISQNLGARREDRIAEGHRKTFLLGLIITVALTIVVYRFAPLIAKCFSDDDAVISVAVQMMKAVSPWFFLMSLREIYTGYLRGFGKSFVPMVLNLVGMVAVRQVYLFFAMGQAVQLEHIFHCYTLAWAATAALLLVYYRLVKRQLRLP